MSRYRFHGLTLEVDPAELEVRARLPRLWADLSWRRLSDDGQRASSHRFALHLHDEPRPLRAGVHQVFSTESFSGFSAGEDDFYVTDSQSLLHLRTDSLEADAWLAPSFFDKPLTLQYTFWSFAIAKLMRSIGLFALHAAGLVRPTNEDGVLIIGRSSSGKTTLTLDAIRHGWRYVSDDAVLLDRAAGGTDAAALGLRRHCYIDSDASARHDGFSFGASTADHTGGSRRRLLGAECAARRADRCVPRLLLFPTIVDHERSVLRPLSEASAFTALLDASCDQLWDRRAMPQHLNTLKALVTQAPAFELQAGLDVYRDPSLILDWLDGRNSVVSAFRRTAADRRTSCAS